jgi:histidyl-tRNA synthetase
MPKLNKNKPSKMFEKRPVKKVAPVETAASIHEAKERSKKAFSVVRGMHDSLPKEEKYWLAFQHEAESLAEYFQFGRIETPILEEANLFVRSIGRGTDVVDKEMYVFEDRDGSKVCLRPEATASVARAYTSNGLWNQSQPVKLWYLGPMFRHDRPQAGRYRQFNQVGFETIGVKDPAIDAELILVAFNFYKDLGIPVEMRVNSIGTVEERNRYKSELVNYYRTKRSYLCEDCRQRLTKNPLRLLDCKEEQCQPVKEEAPQIIDWLTEESKNYFMKVLEYLDEVGVPYVLAPFLVRGLDYYTHTVFEIFATEGENAGAQSALGAGGRYDLLVEELGGKPAAAAGFALGLERIVSVLKQQGPNQSALFAEKKPHVFFAQLGEEAKRRGLKIINELKGSGLRIAYNFFKTSLKTQLEAANSQGVAYVLILGQKEVQDKTIIIRDMESGVQEIVDQKKVESALKKKLSLV